MTEVGKDVLVPVRSERRIHRTPGCSVRNETESKGGEAGGSEDNGQSEMSVYGRARIASRPRVAFRGLEAKGRIGRRGWRRRLRRANEHERNRLDASFQSRPPTFDVAR